MRFVTLPAIALAFMLSGCATETVREELDPAGRVVAREFKGGSVDYARYLEAESQPKAPAVDATACQGDARCVENLAAFHALSQVAGGNRSNIAPPAPRRTGWDRVESIAGKLIGITPALGGQYVAIKASEHSRDVSINRDNSTRDIATAGLDGMRDVARTSIAFARPSYYSAGAMVFGDQHIGDTVGDGSATHGSQIGDAMGDGNATGGSQIGDTLTGDGNAAGRSQVGDQIGGDQIGRDFIGGDRRDDSPGPIDNSDNGDCDGEGGCDNSGDGG
jgi:hypothetical protein